MLATSMWVTWLTGYSCQGNIWCAWRTFVYFSFRNSVIWLAVRPMKAFFFLMIGYLFLVCPNKIDFNYIMALFLMSCVL